MGRTPCCDKEGLKKGPWTPDEDKILTNYIQKNGHGSWRALPKLAGLMRCGKSCRLRWTNYLRPDIKRGAFTEEEERSIIQLHAILGNRWSAIASQLPGRTDNEIKNYWNTRIRKKLLKMGLDPQTHTPKVEAGVQCGEGSWLVMAHKSQWENARLQAEARHSRATILSSFKSQHYFMSSSLSDQDSSSGGAPVDYFLKIWNSEAGKNFRARTNLKIWNSEAGKNFRARTNNINNPVSIHHHHQSMFSEETSYKHDQNPNPNTESLYSNSFGSLEMGMQACQVVEDMSYNNNARGQQEEQLSDSEHDLLGELQLEDQSTNNNFEGDHAYATRIELQQQQSTWPWPDLDLQEYEHDRCDWNGISDI